MDEYASGGLEDIQQHQTLIHKLTPNETHDDKNHMDVKVNLTRREKEHEEV